MNVSVSGRVWCDTSVESATVWLDDEDCSPTDLCRRLLDESPRFALNVQEEALDAMLYVISRGILQIRSGELGVYSLSPIRAEGYTWDPEANRLRILAVSALWTLAAPQLRGEIAPLLYSSICRRFYQSVLGRIIESDLEQRMKPWRTLSSAEAEARISADVLESFRSLAERFPASHYQSVVRERSMEGDEPGTIYVDVCRDMMGLASGDSRSLSRRH
jgi:hypothetical protein